jgi:hypothetical protein
MTRSSSPAAKILDHLSPPRCGDDPHVVLSEIVADHVFHNRVIFDNADARRLTISLAHAQTGLAKSRGSISAVLIEI